MRSQQAGAGSCSSLPNLLEGQEQLLLMPSPRPQSQGWEGSLFLASIPPGHWEELSWEKVLELAYFSQGIAFFFFFFGPAETVWTFVHFWFLPGEMVCT